MMVDVALHSDGERTTFAVDLPIVPRLYDLVCLQDGRIARVLLVVLGAGRVGVQAEVAAHALRLPWDAESVREMVEATA